MTDPVEIDVGRTLTTATGFVTEHVETQHTPTGVVTARHAAEAPMIRA